MRIEACKEMGRTLSDLFPNAQSNKIGVLFAVNVDENRRRTVSRSQQEQLLCSNDEKSTARLAQLHQIIFVVIRHTRHHEFHRRASTKRNVRNLPEKMNVNKLVAEIREMFSVFGNILEIVAKKNIKARGQAFVVFDSADSAKEAIDELQGFEIGGQEIVLAFAKSRSDATVQREDGQAGLEAHKSQRQAAEAAEAAKRAALKRATDEANGDRPAKKVAAAGAAAADEHLPPNKTLILRDLPEDYTQQILTSIFGRYPGFKEIRMVPGRAGLAFAEYESEDGAIMAKTEMHQKVLAGKTVKVTYQRQ
nr:u1 small nuclear ribonucleoprotein [Quercus suber]